MAPEPTTEEVREVPQETGQLEPGSHWVADVLAEHDDDNDDADSAYVPDSDSTASITSSIFEYRSVNGRTYHSDKFDTKYWGANDHVQSEAMDVQHHVWTLALKEKLYLAPIDKNIERAVDIGTGTGIWAIDFGDEFPNCHVIGTDISVNQQPWTPPNVEFQIDDLNERWTFKENTLDYIHTRWMIGSIGDWPKFMRQAYRCLKPGGWIETYESAMEQWFHIFTAGARKLGSNASFSIVGDGEQRRSIEAAGFTNITDVPFKIPVGTCPKDPKLREIKKLELHILEADIAGFITFPAGSLG